MSNEPSSRNAHLVMSEQTIDHAAWDSWCAGEEWCPVTAATDQLCGKWDLVVVDRLLIHGPLGYNDLLSHINGVSNKVLSDVLKNLQEAEIVDREIVNEQPVRVQYSLTTRGRELESVLGELRTWSETYLAPSKEASREQA